jgi:RyR domain
MPSFDERLRFIVAGDNDLAGLVAWQIHRGLVPVRLLTKSQSKASSVVEEQSLIDLGSACSVQSLERAGVSGSTHIVLFPADLSELFRMLATVGAAYKPEGSHAFLTVFAGLPSWNATMTFRRSSLTLDLGPNVRTEFFFLPEDIAGDLMYQHFNEANWEPERSFVLLGDTEVAQAIATKLGRIGSTPKIRLDWIVSDIEQTQATISRLGEMLTLEVHKPDSPFPLPEDQPESDLKPVFIAARPENNVEAVLALGTRNLTRLSKVYVYDPYAKRLNQFWKDAVKDLPGQSVVRFFGDLREITGVLRFLEKGRFGLAKAIHEEYLQRQGPFEQNPRQWDQLSPDHQRANLEQADHLAYKLCKFGYRIVDAKSKAHCAEFLPDELSDLVRLEHERWVADRKLAGWTRGAVRDNELKRDPTMVPFGDLPQTEKVMHREAVEAIPEVLSRVGLKMCRREV